MSLGIHHAHLSLWVGSSLSAWLSDHAIIWLVRIRLSLPHLIVRSLVHCICDQLINSMGIPFFFFRSHEWNTLQHMLFKLFLFLLLEQLGIDTCLDIVLSPMFTSTSQYCVE